MEFCFFAHQLHTSLFQEEICILQWGQALWAMVASYSLWGPVPITRHALCVPAPATFGPLQSEAPDPRVCWEAGKQGCGEQGAAQPAGPPGSSDKLQACWDLVWVPLSVNSDDR